MGTDCNNDEVPQDATRSVTASAGAKLQKRPISQMSHLNNKISDAHLALTLQKKKKLFIALLLLLLLC